MTDNNEMERGMRPARGEPEPGMQGYSRPAGAGGRFDEAETTGTDTSSRAKGGNMRDAGAPRSIGYARYATAFMDGLSHHVVWIQGAYFLIMGLWPLLSLPSFLYITGPKTDIWLTNSVGTLLIVSGFVLLMAAYRRRVVLEIAALGVGDALALIIIEMIYVIGRTISPIYLVDSLVQVLLILGWFRRTGPLD